MQGRESLYCVCVWLCVICTILPAAQRIAPLETNKVIWTWTWTCQTLKQMGSSSRWPHRVPLLSAKSRKRRMQFTQDHQNWAIQDWKNVAWSDESCFLLQHSDGRVRIWHKDERMDPSCLVSTVQAGGGDVMVWGCGGYFLGTLSTNLALFTPQPIWVLLLTMSIPLCSVCSASSLWPSL